MSKDSDAVIERLSRLADDLEYAYHRAVEAAEIEHGMEALRSINGILARVTAEYDRLAQPRPFVVP